MVIYAKRDALPVISCYHFETGVTHEVPLPEQFCTIAAGVNLVSCCAHTCSLTTFHPTVSLESTLTHISWTLLNRIMRRTLFSLPLTLLMRTRRLMNTTWLQES